MRKFDMRNFAGHRFVLPVSLAVTITISGCTAPSETTGIGAATGGAIGAGLGAIIGSQTGDPGAGLVIGALAGSAGGGLVGNALQAQEEAIKTQDEAIERQERVISAQRRELNELRQMRGDAGPPLRNSGVESDDLGRVDSPIEPLGRMKERSLTGSASSALEEREIKTTSPATLDTADTSTGGSALTPPGRRRATFPVQDVGRAATSTVSIDPSDSEECRKAGNEMQSATKTSDASEQLFHIRRALRLCPDKPAFHSELAKVYRKLGRDSDAEFELSEAKRLGDFVSAPSGRKARDRY
jgi:hypothetical protein